MFDSEKNARSEGHDGGGYAPESPGICVHLAIAKHCMGVPVSTSGGPLPQMESCHARSVVVLSRMANVARMKGDTSDCKIAGLK